MRAIVLSAGQGRRLLPLTEREPKCLLPIGPAAEGERVLELQLAALARCGVERATVVVGFGARRVERALARAYFPGLAVDTLYNPFFSLSDNLATCWLARHLMEEDFLLLNGDTLFEDALLRRVLDQSSGEINVTVDHKDAYDDDDMKVALDADGQLLGIGKVMEPELVGGESIGLLCFRDGGPKRFRAALDDTIRDEGALGSWYLSVIDRLAQAEDVHTVSIRGLWWREIDSPEDLEEARASWPGAR